MVTASFLDGNTAMTRNILCVPFVADRYFIALPERRGR
jgi:hypothetical protein